MIKHASYCELTTIPAEPVVFIGQLEDDMGIRDICRCMCRK